MNDDKFMWSLIAGTILGLIMLTLLGVLAEKSMQMRCVDVLKDKSAAEIAMVCRK